MTETLDPMAATVVDQKQLAEQLLAQAKEQGVELMGPTCSATARSSPSSSKARAKRPRRN